MKILSALALAAMLVTSGAAVAEARHPQNDNRQGYQSYHYAPRSYGSRGHTVYRRGYRGPSNGYYPYQGRHYGQRTIYFNFFGLPIVTY